MPRYARDHAGGARVEGAQLHARNGDAEARGAELGAPPETRVRDRDRAVRALSMLPIFLLGYVPEALKMRRILGDIAAGR